MQFNTFAGDYYRRQAEADVAREDAAVRQARIEARESQLVQQDAEALVALACLLGRGARGCGRVLWSPSRVGQGWENGDGEIIFGTLVLGTAAAIVTIAAISHLANRSARHV